MARRTAGTTTLVALVLLGVACCAHAQVESPRVRDRRHRELTRGMNEQQREQMRMLSEQGLTGEQARSHEPFFLFCSARRSRDPALCPHGDERSPPNPPAGVR